MMTIFGTMMAMVIVIACIAIIASYVMTALGYMQCMKKAGEAGWKAWVPFYNDFVMYKIVGLSGGLIAVKAVYAFLVSVVLSMSIMYISKIGNYTDNYLNNTYSSSSYRTNTKKRTTGIHTNYVNIYPPYDLDDDDFDEEIISDVMNGGIGLSIASTLESVAAIGVLVVNIFFAIRISKAYGLGGGYIAGMILVPGIFILIIGFGKSEYKGNYVPKSKEVIQ
ncbi:MAG: hypothetical protein IKE01_07050 [Clostridia bacterium]|nr:hypothetical protein [Clostridia bacterium]